MKFLHPEKVVAELIQVMEDYERYLLARWPSASIVVHDDWREAPAAGVKLDQHVLGRAVDFHVVNVSALDSWLALERFPRITGLGGYPDWNHPGFHADVRPTAHRERWARAGAAYVAFDAATIDKLKKEV